MSAGDHYLLYKASYAHVQRAHGPISRCGRQVMVKYAQYTIVQRRLAGDQILHYHACVEGVANDILWVWSQVER